LLEGRPAKSKPLRLQEPELTVVYVLVKREGE
jgi:hypothetical protein